MQQYFGEKNLKKYDLTSSMAEKGSPTLNSRRFGVWHGKKGDIEKLFLLILLPFFQVARKAEALQLQRQSHIRFDESEDEEHT